MTRRWSSFFAAFVVALVIAGGTATTVLARPVEGAALAYATGGLDAGRWRLDEAGDLDDRGRTGRCGPLRCQFLQDQYEAGQDPTRGHLDQLGYGLASLTSLLDLGLVMSGQRPLDLETTVALGKVHLRLVPSLRGLRLTATF